MTKKALSVLFGLFLCLSAFAANKQFDTVIVSGDSMSDNGNLYRYMFHLLPVSPPYYKGHFTNGPLWIEQLYHMYYPAGNTEGFQDYAVGGAGAVLSYKESLPYTLTVELNNYLYWHTYGKKDTSLFVIWIGANNYLNGPTNIDSLTSSVVDATGSVIEKIIKQGGNKFLLVNLPDLGLSPHAADLKMEHLLTNLVNAHNKKLEAKYDKLKTKYPDVTFVYFDIYALFSNALEHANDFGFNNVTEPCYIGSYSGWLVKYQPDDETLFSYLKQRDPRFDQEHWDMIKNNPELKEAAIASFMYFLLPKTGKKDDLNCDGYAFWDRIHPTTVTHNLIAQGARQLIDEAGLRAY